MAFFARSLIAALAIAGAGLAASASANATPSYSVLDFTANQNGAAFYAQPDMSGFNTAGSIAATFSYTGSLNFNNTTPQNSTNAGDLNSSFFANGSISNYSGSGILAAPSGANYSTQSSFLNSSGSAAGYQYGSLIEIDLGVLAAGTNLTITHDDGISVYQAGVRLGNTNSGPTSAVTDLVTTTGSGDVELYYSEQNGTPSVLNVAVPEPASLAVLGAGLFGLGMIRRRRAGQQVAAA